MLRVYCNSPPLYVGGWRVMRERQGDMLTKEPLQTAQSQHLKLPYPQPPEISLPQGAHREPNLHPSFGKVGMVQSFDGLVNSP